MGRRTRFFTAPQPPGFDTHRLTLPTIPVVVIDSHETARTLQPSVGLSRLPPAI